MQNFVHCRWEEHKIVVDWMRKMYIFVDKRALRRPSKSESAADDVDSKTLTWHGLQLFYDVRIEPALAVQVPYDQCCAFAIFDGIKF